MPRKPKEVTVEVDKAVNTEELARFKLSEIGYVGLKVSAGIAQEELKRELQFPQSMVTYKQMSYHSVIAAALSLYEIMITKVEWNVRPPENATEEEIRRADFIEECMCDMEHSWLEFIQEVVSVVMYGFSVHEKVYRRRLKSNGSKFNDGLIGWKKLPIRSQDTIDKFYFDDGGRELTGVRQNLNLVNDSYNRFGSLTVGAKEVNIPRSKFMLFRTGKSRGNPFGKSKLRDCYFSWKFLTQIEEIEAAGVARDLQGMPILKIPSTYMTSDATPEQKKILAYYMNAIRNIQQNQQSGMILPSEVDPESKMPMFELDLLGTEGKKNFNTENIIDQHKKNILTALHCDSLILGQSSTGSFALASSKESLMYLAVESILREIQEVINNDLIKQTYELNGWDTSRMATVHYDDFEEENLEEFSKAAQRYASTGLLELDRQVLNKIRMSIGVDALPIEEDVHYDRLTNNSSRSGDGFATAGEGTSNTVSGQDTSSNNLENVG